MDGVQPAGMMSRRGKNQRVGLALAAITVGLMVYSFLVIKTKGREPEPANLTKVQRILRGL